jgi:hypothetical protein
MPSSDAFAFSRSGLNEFLFAPVGTEANGMTLSVVSVFARSGNDPWVEAGRLARLPKLEATESLGRIIASMPTSIWPLQAATAIAARLVALLPTSSAEPMQSLLAPGIRARLGRFLGFTVVLVCLGCVLAYQTGIFATSDGPKPDASGVASLAVSPPR